MKVRRAAIAAVLVLGALSTGCAATGATPRPFPRPGTGRIDPVAVPTELSLPALVETALSLRGTPYRDGGDDPSGFDCSGFVAFVFGRHGVTVPRTVSEQFDAARPVSGTPAAGDLVFFSTVAPGPTHVGIMTSQAEFVHAPSSRGVVRVEPLRAGYWRSRLVGVRRIP